MALLLCCLAPLILAFEPLKLLLLIPRPIVLKLKSKQDLVNFQLKNLLGVWLAMAMAITMEAGMAIEAGMQRAVLLGVKAKQLQQQ